MTPTPGTTPAPLRVAAVQHDIAWEDRDANLARLAPLVARATATGARLVVLTEMFATGFSMRTEVTAEPIDGPSSQWLAEQAAARDVWVAASVPELADGADKPHNTLVLAGPGGERHRYRKVHPFTYAGEREHFAAGDELVTVTVDGVRVGLFVCFDLRFADEFWALAHDVDAYLVPANWPAPRRRHWTALLDARAIENLAYVVGVNRVGDTPTGLAYAGDSRIVGPLGEVLASAEQAETILLADLDPAAVTAARERFGFLADRRDPGPVRSR